MHPVVTEAFTVAFGTTRVVPTNTPMVAFEYGQYSVPHQLMGATVWVRVHGQGVDEQVIITHIGGDGPTEVARHRRATPGTPETRRRPLPGRTGRRPGTHPAGQDDRGG